MPVSGGREVKDGWMMRVASRASWEGGGTRAGLSRRDGVGAPRRARGSVLLPSLSRPDRMWIAAESGPEGGESG